MFGGIGSFEIMAIALIALLVLGPEELPKFVRKVSSIFGQIKSAGDELRRQAGVDELLREGRASFDQGVRKIREEVVPHVPTDLFSDDEPAQLATETTESIPAESSVPQQQTLGQTPGTQSKASERAPQASLPPKPVTPPTFGIKNKEAVTHKRSDSQSESDAEGATAKKSGESSR